MTPGGGVRIAGYCCRSARIFSAKSAGRSCRDYPPGPYRSVIASLNRWTSAAWARSAASA